MQTINIQRAVIGALSILVFQALGACGDSGGSDGAGGGGGAGTGLPSTGANGTASTVSSSSSTGGAGPTSGSTTSTSSTGGGDEGGGCIVVDCDDGVACTIDACSPSGGCTHALDDGACGPGEYCELIDGCHAAPPCTDVEDCELAWGNDPCKVDLACDVTTALCSFSILDQDGDEHPPVGCGGDDCDDTDGERYPGHPEECDGIDNDCDDEIDGPSPCEEGATCTYSGLGGGFYACQCDNPVCANDLYACEIDFQTNINHCGDCDTACPSEEDFPMSGASCVSGTCECDNSERTLCPAQPGVTEERCADLLTESAHCGSCENACEGNEHCSDGECCLFGFESCSGQCVDVQNDQQNCSSCGNDCDADEFCDEGQCITIPSGDGGGGFKSTGEGGG